jgi:hypothetical protein
MHYCITTIPIELLNLLLYSSVLFFEQEEQEEFQAGTDCLDLFVLGFSRIK